MRVLVVFFTVAFFAGLAFATGHEIPDPVGEPAQESAAPETPEPAPPAAPAPVAPTGKVTRASFTTAIENREPVDSIETLTNDRTEIFFFSELQNMMGQTITHQWKFQNEVMAEVSFDVGGPRWRVYSSKRLFPGWLGDWTVVVTDASQNELATHRFSYVPGTPPVESGPPSTGAATEASAPSKPKMIPEEAPALPEVEAAPSVSIPVPGSEAAPISAPDEGLIQEETEP
jgi:hypothetical protein